MARRRINAQFGDLLSRRLDVMGYGSAKQLASATDRAESAVTRWKGGEVPPKDLWPAIDQFLGSERWVEKALEMIEMQNPDRVLDAETIRQLRAERAAEVRRSIEDAGGTVGPGDPAFEELVVAESELLRAERMLAQARSDAVMAKEWLSQLVRVDPSGGQLAPPDRLDAIEQAVRDQADAIRALGDLVRSIAERIAPGPGGR